MIFIRKMPQNDMLGVWFWYRFYRSSLFQGIFEYYHMCPQVQSKFLINYLRACGKGIDRKNLSLASLSDGNHHQVRFFAFIQRASIQVSRGSGSMRGNPVTFQKIFENPPCEKGWMFSGDNIPFIDQFGTVTIRIVAYYQVYVPYLLGWRPDIVLIQKSHICTMAQFTPIFRAAAGPRCLE